GVEINTGRDVADEPDVLTCGTGPIEMPIQPCERSGSRGSVMRAGTSAVFRREIEVVERNDACARDGGETNIVCAQSCQVGLRSGASCARNTGNFRQERREAGEEGIMLVV